MSYVVLLYVAMLANQPVSVPGGVWRGKAGLQECQTEARIRNTRERGWHCIEIAE
jgi:hypothetical protein